MAHLMRQTNGNKRYRLLLHIGLPKTATTSLQHNVLMPLHEEGRINFLGRLARDYALLYDILEDNDCYSFIRRPLSREEIPGLRRRIETLLDPSKLNVLSNENFSGLQPVYRNTVDLRAMLTNMSRLFENCDVVLMLSLREPTALFRSQYAENIFWPTGTQERVEFSELTANLLSQQRTVESDYLLPLFYEEYVRVIARSFPNIKVLLYEDIQNDPPCYFRQLADCLDMDDPLEIERMFGASRRNASRHSTDGLSVKHRKVLTLSFALRIRYRRMRWVYNTLVRPAISRFPLLGTTLRKLFSFRIGLNMEHAYPDPESRNLVRDKLSVRTDYLTETFGVDRDKLVRYGYRAAPVDSTSLSTGSA